jgi:hypothetical protein
LKKKFARNSYSDWSNDEFDLEEEDQSQGLENAIDLAEWERRMNVKVNWIDREINYRELDEWWRYNFDYFSEICSEEQDLIKLRVT